MSKGINKVIIVGNLGRDPEIRYTTDGRAIANFSVAVNEEWKDKQGQKQERTEWVRCIAFQRLAEIVGEYLQQGSQVYVEGKLQTREYTDKQGVKHYPVEVVIHEMQMLGARQNGGDQRGQTGRGGYKSQPGEAAPQPQSQLQAGYDFNDAIPF